MFLSVIEYCHISSEFCGFDISDWWTAGGGEYGALTRHVAVAPHCV